MAYYRAATLYRLGRREEARAEMERAKEFPYGFDIRDFLGAFRDPNPSRELLETLRSLGFDPSSA